MLPDNFGTDWSSGCYGSELAVHVQWACQIYDHSGNKTFLRHAYDFYKELFKASASLTLIVTAPHTHVHPTLTCTTHRYSRNP